MAAKKTEITYTPEELAEIDRIINVISEEHPEHIAEVKPREIIQPVKRDEPADEYEIENYDSEIPSDLNIDEDIAEKPVKSKKQAEEEYEFSTGETPAEPEEGEIEDITDILAETEPVGKKTEEEIYSLSDDELSFIDDTETKSAKK